MNTQLVRRARRRKQKLKERNDRCSFGDGRPVIGSGNRKYELSERVSATPYGGVGPVLDLLRRSGLAALLDEHLHLLHSHRPYHESDHVINLVLNFLCGGTCLDDLSRLRDDSAFLDALGTRRIPDPTTAGDFLRRFGYDDNITLMDVMNLGNQWAWKMAGTAKTNAVLDVDSSILETTGEKKQKMDISYTGKWGFHPLLITEANTGTDICLVNRPGNHTSQQDAAYWIEYAIAAVEEHFGRVYLRGDSAFNLTYKFDEWDSAGIEFCFGCAATQKMQKKAENLPASRWKSLRPGLLKSAGETDKQRRARERNFHNIQAHREHVAEFSYRPTKCSQDYRIIVVRKTLVVSGGQRGLFGALETRYFFYVTNITEQSGTEMVGFIHKRCNHENRIEQLKNGLPALHAPCADFQANQAWMLIGALAHNIKSWLCLMHPEPEVRHQLIATEFKSFFRDFILIPCQILRTGRRIVFRFLGITRAFQDLLDIVRVLHAAPA